MHCADCSDSDKRNWHPGTGPVHSPPHRLQGRQVQGPGGADAGWCKLGCLPNGLARAVPPGRDGGIGHISVTRQTVPLQRVRRNAGPTWVIAPDRQSLEQRWKRLIAESDKNRKEILFHPHGSEGVLGDRHTGKVMYEGLTGHAHRTVSVANDKEDVIPPIRYGFRSFDRQWIIPDIRVVNRPNPALWDDYSPKQIYLTAPHDRTPTNGPALSFTALIPDLHHYHGRGGLPFRSGLIGPPISQTCIQGSLASLLKSTRRLSHQRNCSRISRPWPQILRMSCASGLTLSTSIRSLSQQTVIYSPKQPSLDVR